jgi:predicted metal-binding protein
MEELAGPMKEKLKAALAAAERASGVTAHEYAVLPVSALVFSPELLKACESNTCGNYNKNWTCPPANGTLEEQKRKISACERAFVFTTKRDLEDSFDYEGMVQAKENHCRLTAELREKICPGFPVYGAGGCSLCETCARPEPCRFPGKAIPPIEGAGIDVTGLSREAGIKYNNGPNTVTYFSMVLFNG